MQFHRDTAREKRAKMGYCTMDYAPINILVCERFRNPALKNEPMDIKAKTLLVSVAIGINYCSSANDLTGRYILP
jgi:hypothetical protein